MNRRKFLYSASGAAAALLSMTAAGAARAKMKMMKMVPPWEWTRKHGLVNNLRKDPNPLDHELEKYPRCPYCGMSRKMWSHTRHLIQYDDDSTEGTCSIRCASLSLALNLDRVPKRIWVGDAGCSRKVKRLIDADKAHYIILDGKMGTMTHRRKWAFSDPAKAQAMGGQQVGFDQALRAAYADQASDTIMIRKRRAEKRAHMMKKMHMMQRMKMKGMK